MAVVSFYKETVTNLAYAVAVQAVEDYKAAIRHDDERMIGDCERFFRSGLFAWICPNVDEEVIIKELRKQAKTKQPLRMIARWG